MQNSIWCLCFYTHYCHVFVWLFPSSSSQSKGWHLLIYQTQGHSNVLSHILLCVRLRFSHFGFSVTQLISPQQHWLSRFTHRSHKLRGMNEEPSRHWNQHMPSVHLRVFEWLAKQRLELTPTACVKCIYSHYSGLSPAANLYCCYKENMPEFMPYIMNPVTKGLFAQINSLLIRSLTVSSPERTRRANCMTSCIPFRHMPLIVRANKAMHMQSGTTCFHSRPWATGEQACCRLDGS